jgi:hypothetical protein
MIREEVGDDRRWQARQGKIGNRRSFDDCYYLCETKTRGNCLQSNGVVSEFAHWMALAARLAIQAFNFVIRFQALPTQ